MRVPVPVQIVFSVFLVAAAGLPASGADPVTDRVEPEAVAPRAGANLPARRAEASSEPRPADVAFIPIPLPEFKPPLGKLSAGDSRGIVTHDLRTDQTESRPSPGGDAGGATSGKSAPSEGALGTSAEGGLSPSAFSGLTLVSDTTTYPQRTNVKLFFSNENGNFVGSGILIHPRYVLTAGHCVYDHVNGAGWADTMRVVPGYQNVAEPFGDAYAVSLTSLNGWTVDEDFNYDIAIVELDRPVGSVVGWLAYGWNSDNGFWSGRAMNNGSYPGESPYNGLEQYFRSGTYDSIATELFEHNNPSYGGQSGSGSYGADDSVVASVVSYHRNNRTITGQPRITQAKFDAFQAQIASTTPAAPDLQILDLNAQPLSAAPGSTLTGLNYLVFNHSSAAWSGSISLDVYLSADNVITTGDTYLQTRTLTANIPANGSTRITSSSGFPTIPGGTPNGTRYLGAIITTVDSDTANNATRAPDTQPITISGGSGPANDLWSDSLSFGPAPVQTTGSNVGATTESGEPNVGPAGATVWWYYQGQGDGTLTVSTAGSNFDTMLDVYEGFENGTGFAGLTRIADNDDAHGTYQSEVSFPIVSGKYYEIRVGGYNGATGSIQLAASFTPVSGNPLITVRGNGQTIANGDNTPAAGDGTDLGESVVGQTTTRTFTISNTGTAPLHLTGIPRVSIAGSAAFSILSQPSTPVSAGGSTSFVVGFTPTAAGGASATVSVASNDTGATPFTFGVAGEGIPGAGILRGTVWRDRNRDGVRQGGDDASGGVRVYLDLDGNGSRGGGEPSLLTEPDGSYEFSGLTPGIYTVALDLGSTGLVQTAPGAAGGKRFPASAAFGAMGADAKAPRILDTLTTTSSSARTVALGEPMKPPLQGDFSTMDLEANSVINLDLFRADPRFAGIDGSGWAVAVLDTGVDVDHPAFGPDANGDGIADRIVFQYDYVNNDPDGSDDDNHGSNVASIAVASSASLMGVAPGADLINLKVLGPGGGSFAMLESALQWIAANQANFRIASINMSLGDSGNYQTSQALYGIDDEMAALVALDVAVVSASGNSFYGFSSQQGVSYPAADANSMSIGATFDANHGPVSWQSGAQAFTSAVDRITPFSQRHQTLTTVFAPGAFSLGASWNGGTTDYTGTSQASPVVAGACALAQQLAERTLGRRLTQAELVSMLRSSAVTINDGDDEDDNVTNTGLNFPRIDMLAFGEAILALSPDPLPFTWRATIEHGQETTGADFGVHRPASTPDLTSATDTGVSDSDNLTRDNTPTFSGTAFPGASVVLSSSVAGTIATTVADGSGNWSATSSTGLAHGAHQISAAADGSPSSGALGISIDTVVPSLSLEKAPGQADPASTGPVAFRVVASEAVFGFANDDVSVQGSLSGTPSVSGGPETFTLSIATGGNEGRIGASVPADRLTDAAGNGNTASTSVDNLVQLDAHGGSGQPPTSLVVQSGTSASESGWLEPGDIDSFSFTLTSVKQVTASTSGSLDTWGVLTDASANVLNQPSGDHDAGPGANFLFKVILPPGTYRLEVSAIGGATTGDYGLSLILTDPPVLINEVQARSFGNDSAEFVELYDGGVGNTPLDEFVLVFYADNESSYLTVDLGGEATDENGYFVVGSEAVAAATLVLQDGVIENGTSAVALYAGDSSEFPEGTPLTTSMLLDAVVYLGEGQTPSSILVPLLLPGEEPLSESKNGFPAGQSLQRIPDGQGGARVSSGFDTVAVTPGAPNQYPGAPNTLDLDPGSDTGDSQGDRLTKDDTPQFFGTAAPGAIVRLVSDRDGELGLAYTVGNGVYALEAVSAALSEGVHTITASTLPGELAGPTLEIEIDTTPPSVPGSLVLLSDSGVSDSDRVTNVKSPAFSGASVSGPTVELLVDGSVVASGAGGPSWTLAVPGHAPLDDGVRTVSARARDAAGNASGESTPVGVTIDSQAPGGSIGLAGGQPNPATGGPVGFSVGFTEEVFGFESGDLSVGGNAAGSASVSGGPAQFGVSVATVRPEGFVTVGVGAGIATDRAGNPNSALGSSSVRVDLDLHDSFGGTPSAIPLSSGLANRTGYLHPGDSDLFSFTLDGPRVAVVYTTGDADTRGRLRNADGILLNDPESDHDAGGEGNFRIVKPLPAGTYSVEVDAFGAEGDYALVIEAVDLPRIQPDVIINGRGNNVYENLSGQTSSLTSRRARAVRFSTVLENDGEIADAFNVFGTRGNALFRVVHRSGSSGNVTAGFSAGTHQTQTVLAGAESERFTTSVYPNKKKISKKRKKKGKVRTTYRRVNQACVIRASSRALAVRSDSVMGKTATR